MGIAFIVISILSIVGGGLVSAFSAKRSSRLASWASAYLVLIAGLTQLGLVTSWQSLGKPSISLAPAAFTIYNLGNICVLLGTIYKTRLKRYSLIVNFGGALLALAMILLLLTTRDQSASWTLVGFLALVIVILISMPIGLTLSARRDNIRH